jgi:8-oxo-dGTP diphosphatase
VNRNTAPTARYALDLLLDRDSRLLMLKRSRDAHLGPGKWGVPAGKIEPGETPEAAAMREMAEEIGPDHRVDLVRYVGPFRDTYYGGQFEIHLFQFDWTAGSVVLNDEHTCYAWVAPAAFRGFDVMDGIDEDIAILGFWPQRYLDPARIPAHLLRD